jgi:NCS2 family nucleobase:cation symporter-2
MVAPRWTRQLAYGLHPLLESGILLTAAAAVVLNTLFNGTKGDTAGAIEAAKTAEAH